MKRADFIGGVILTLFGIFAITQAARLDYWSRFGPGPGFVPLWSSIIIVAGGILLTIQAIRKRVRAVSTLDGKKVKGLVNVAIVALLTMITAMMLSVVGFTASVFIYVAVLVGGIGRHKWHVGLLTGAITALAFYVVFARWLEVPLPKGIMGF